MTLLLAIVLVPLAGCVAAGLVRNARAVLALCVLGGIVELALVVTVLPSASAGRVTGAWNQLAIDALSAYHLVVVVSVFALSSAYACSYFAAELRSGQFGASKARRFGVTWFAFLGSMVLVLAANNVGIMWVAMEATTLASALLVCLSFERASIRAAWSYLMICSVGIALALLGTFLLCGAARAAEGSGASPLLWTELSRAAPHMAARPVKLAFLFLLVGYGTKAGLAPMHTWLPDAHSQAPTPVSAVLSGVLLNCALYCISRFLPIAEAATGHRGWAQGLLVILGLASIVVAAAFIVVEHDVKRLLAYSSVEHMGIIALGFGLGGASAALYHTLNHSICKMLAFFCAGGLVHRYGTRDMRLMRGILSSVPLAGFGLVLGILALIGAPGFSIFMSELWILKVGIERHQHAAVAVFLLGAAVVFVAALNHALDMVGKRAAPQGQDTSGRGPHGVELARQPAEVPRPGDPSVRVVRWPLVVIPLAVLIATGVWMPGPLADILNSAAAIVRGGAP